MQKSKIKSWQEAVEAKRKQQMRNMQATEESQAEDTVPMLDLGGSDETEAAKLVKVLQRRLAEADEEISLLKKENLENMMLIKTLTRENLILRKAQCHGKQHYSLILH